MLIPQNPSTGPIPNSPSRARQVIFLALLTAASALLMSPLGWRAYLLVGGVYVPEFFAIPAALVCLTLGHNPVSDALRSRAFTWWAAFCGALMLLGFLLHGDILAAYSDFRCLLALGIAYIGIRKHNDLESVKPYVAYFMLLSLFFNAAALSLLPADLTNAKYSFPVLCLVIAIYVCGTRGWYLVLAACFSIGAYLTVHSFYRQNFAILAICGLAILASLFGNQDRYGRRRYGTAMLFFLGLLASLTYLPIVVAEASVFFRSNEARYIQIIGKSRELFAALSGSGTNNTGDATRIYYLQFIWDHLIYFIPPSGLGQKVLVNQWRSLWMSPSESMIGSSLDGGHLFMAAHFGLIITMIMATTVARQYSNALRSTPLERRPMLVLLGIATLFAFVGSSPFSQMSFASAFGLCLGFLLHPNQGAVTQPPKRGRIVQARAGQTLATAHGATDRRRS